MTQISYQLTAVLAEGAIYRIYRGLAYLPDGETREVLLKQLQPHIVQDPVILSHLAGFSDVARGLQHPNLAPLWDLGQYAGQYYYVREYLPGCSLQHLLTLVQRGEAILSPAMAIYITQEVAEAIAALHRYRVPGDQPIYLFHGGLSPENVILTRIGGVVLTDAGLDVIFWRNPEIQAWLRQRKAAYQPPEYSAGQRPMRRGDTFGVGALLYHMLMNQPLWEASPHWFDSLQMTLPSQHHHRITEQFDELLQEILHPSQEQRQVQIEHLRQQLAKPGLLRQAKAERREATAYIEALVMQALQQPPQETLLEIQPPFHLDSLLPNRPELPPPHKRYRPPQFDETSSFHPRQNDGPSPTGMGLTPPQPLDDLHSDPDLISALTGGRPTQANATRPSAQSSDEIDIDDFYPPTPLGQQAEQEQYEEDRTSVAPIPAAPSSSSMTLGDLLDTPTPLSTPSTPSVPGPVPIPASPPLPGQESKAIPLVQGHRPPPPPSMGTGTQPGMPPQPEPEFIPQADSSTAYPEMLAVSPDTDASFHAPLEDSEAHEEIIDSTIVASMPDEPPTDPDEIIPLSDSMEMAADEILQPEDILSPVDVVQSEDVVTPGEVLPPPSLSSQSAMPQTPEPPAPVSSSDLPGMPGRSRPQQFISTPETMALPIEAISGYPGQLASPPPSFPPTGEVPAYPHKNGMGDAGAQMQRGAFHGQSPGAGHMIPGLDYDDTSPQQAPPVPLIQETVALPIEQITGSRKPPAISPPPDDGLERFGNFVLLNRVAFGGMAEVFRAKLEGHVGFQRIVAVKRILPEYSEDPTFIQMFTDEARIAGSLTHPHIVQINELGEVEGIYYISMEFIDGIDLARVIKIRRTLQQPIPLGIILDVAIPVCNALHYAHTALDPNNKPLNMIHRDVTPHNILISKKGEIKLTDFGIAKASQNISTTAVGELKGKLSYMSPEQAEGRPLDQRTDIFQVGIVLYEMLTLRKMFEGNSDQSILHKIQHAMYPSPRQVAASVPELMEKITLKALAVAPNQRYQTAEELERDLVQLRNNLPAYERHADVASFTQEILEQRDYLLAEMAANRGLIRPQIPGQFPGQMAPPPVAPPGLSPQARSPGTETQMEQVRKKKTAIMSGVIVLVMLLVGGAVGYFLMKSSPPPPPPQAPLNIQTRPQGAEVRLDGERIGVTPLRTKIPFDTQSHILQLIKRGYRPFNHKFKLQHEGDEVDLFLNLVPNRPNKR